VLAPLLSGFRNVSPKILKSHDLANASAVSSQRFGSLSITSVLEISSIDMDTVLRTGESSRSIAWRSARPTLKKGEAAVSKPANRIRQFVHYGSPGNYSELADSSGYVTDTS